MKNHNSFGRDMRQTFLGEVGGVGGGREGKRSRESWDVEELGACATAELL